MRANWPSPGSFRVKEISLRPELSSPPSFIIKGGYSERDEPRTNEQSEILVSNIGLQKLSSGNVIKKNNKLITVICHTLSANF